MNNKLKAILLVFLLLTVVMLSVSCSDDSPYGGYDGDGYSVSVKFDANGGSFSTGSSVIVDTFNIADLPDAGDGDKLMPIIAPNDTRRGTGNYYTAKRSGYFVAGWYTERTPVTDGNGNQLDIDGNPIAESGKEPAYTYSGYWDFKNDKYTVKPGESYSAKEPVVTLYAAWLPEFSFEFCDKDGNAIEGADSITFNPLANAGEIMLPERDEATGGLKYTQTGDQTVKRGSFPKLSGKTFSSVATSLGGDAVDAEFIKHIGEVNFENATATNSTMKLYVDYIDGEWFNISTADQLINAASAAGCYTIEADLDFAGKSWPAGFGNNFTGKIIGGQHTIKNVSVEQARNDRMYNGLFGQLTAECVIENLTFSNITYTVSKGIKATGMNGAAFGLLAGSIAEGAKLENVTVTDSKLVISAKAYLPDGRYEMGLVAGRGTEYTAISYSGITATADNPAGYGKTVTVTTDGNTVSLSFATVSD